MLNNARRMYRRSVRIAASPRARLDVQVENFEADNLAENIADAVKKSGIKIDGVFTHTENLQPVVGQVCEILGIKNNPYTAYEKYAACCFIVVQGSRDHQTRQFDILE
jgi:hypothetical protein